MTPEQLESQVARFIEVREALVILAARLTDELRRWIHPVAPDALIESRAKKATSFAEKILRKRKYADPLREITDLVGIRIVTHLAPETERVVERIRQRFPVDERHSVDKARELRNGEFGYVSKHLVLVLDRPQLGKADLPESMLPLRIEVQVRTLLQHAWSAIGHDRLYKSGFRVPDRWQRQAARIAASLESADADFVELAAGLDAYRGEFGAYMEPRAIREELQLATLVQRHAPDDACLAERRARLALSLGDWTGATATVEGFSGERTPGLWCCLGLARCGQAGTPVPDADCRVGLGEFRHAVQLDGNHREALLLLARHLETRSPDEATSLYGRVLRQDSHDPRALSGSLRVTCRHGEEVPDLGVWIGLAREAVRRCDTWIEVGMDWVAALRLRALFLLLGDEDPGEGLAAVAEAIQACPHSQTLLELQYELAPLRPLRRQRPGFEAAFRMVSLALLARTPGPESRTRVDGWAGAPASIEEPVWIIAGGCAPESAQAMAAARPLLEPAFEDFRGTVISGGTRQGVGGLVGDAAAARPGQFASVGYLPSELAPSTLVTPDDRYSELRRKESGTKFSWNEPLQMWADILRAGIPPAQVTLLGINGGAIAALEFRLAAALGARVGILADSGRAASQLDLPTERKRFPTILRLPADAATLRLFLERPGRTLELPPESLERLARRAHEEYLASVPARVEPSHEPWERLEESLKDSNRDQVRRSIEVLRLGGFVVRARTPESKVREFSTEEIEVLAEAEHGRWVLERLESGWQPGPVKDVAQKRSPHLVPWNQLADQVKEWDRRAVRNLGRRLAEADLTIIRG